MKDWLRYWAEEVRRQAAEPGGKAASSSPAGSEDCSMTSGPPAARMTHDEMVASGLHECASDCQRTADDLAWGTVTPRKCRHPRSARWGTLCDTIRGGCGKDLGEAVSRGRNNRSRGNAIERWVCQLLGIHRVGQYGGLEDGGNADDFLRVQVKSGGAHQAALLAKIHTIPVNAAQLRGWVTVSTPGAGHQREGVISFDLREFAAWYGKGSDEEAA